MQLTECNHVRQQLGHGVEITEKVMTNLDFEELIGTPQVSKSVVE